MIYVDAFGEVSPCVFTPMSFGNIRTRPVRIIYDEMRRLFPSAGSCFMNRNHALLWRHGGGELPMEREKALGMMKEVKFGPPSVFQRIYHD